LTILLPPKQFYYINPIAWALYGIIVTQLGYGVDTRITVRLFWFC